MARKTKSEKVEMKKESEIAKCEKCGSTKTDWLAAFLCPGSRLCAKCLAKERNKNG